MKKGASRHIFLSFLGAGCYSPVRYRTPSLERATEKDEQYIQVARVRDLLRRQVQLSEIVIFVTEDEDRDGKPRPGSRTLNWNASRKGIGNGLRDELHDLCGSDVGIQSVGIPVGYTLDELHEQLSKILESIPEHAHLYVDVTHGFRTIPIFFLIALRYVQKLRNVKVVEVTYGAFDAAEGGVAPTFDLAPMLELDDWAEAWAMFDESGDLGAISRLASHAGNEAGRKLGRDTPRAIGTAVGALSRMSAAIRLVHATGIANSLRDGTEELESVVPELGQQESTRLLAPIFSKFLDELSNWEPKQDDDSEIAEIEAQLNYAEWIAARMQLQASSAILRELCVDLLQVFLVRTAESLPDELDRRLIDGFFFGQLLLVSRDPNAKIASSEGLPYEYLGLYQALVDNIDHLRGLGTLGGRIAELRNPLQHVHRGRASAPLEKRGADQRAQKSLLEICSELRASLDMERGKL